MLAECPWCGKRFETARGGRQHCPHCRAEIELPDAEPPPVDSARTPPAGPSEVSGAPPYGPWEQTSSFPTSTRWVGSGGDEMPNPTPEAPPPPLAPAPWELGEGSLWHSFVETWKGAALHPTRFFRELGPFPSLWPAFGFAFLVSAVVSVFDAIWSWVGIPFYPEYGFLSGPVGLVFELVAIAFMIWLGSGLLHLSLTVLGAGSQGFGATFRTACYASAPLLVGIFPGAEFIGSIWSLVVAVIGLRWTQRTSTGKALLAIFLPAIFLAALTLVVTLTFALALG